MGHLTTTKPTWELFVILTLVLDMAYQDKKMKTVAPAVQKL